MVRSRSFARNDCPWEGKIKGSRRSLKAAHRQVPVRSTDRAVDKENEPPSSASHFVDQDVGQDKMENQEVLPPPAELPPLLLQLEKQMELHQLRINVNNWFYKFRKSQSNKDRNKRIKNKVREARHAAFKERLDAKLHEKGRLVSADVSNGAESEPLPAYCHNSTIGMGVRTNSKLSIGEIAFEFVGIKRKKPNNLAYSFNIQGDEDDEYMAKVSRILGVDEADLLSVQKFVYIDPYDCGNVGRFATHSEYPNVVPIRVFENDLMPLSARLLFVCIREIQAGEEIFIDYGALHDWIPTCLCNSPVCGMSRLHLMSMKPEEATDVMLNFQHRHRNGEERRTSEDTRLNIHGEQGKLLLRKAAFLLKVEEDRLEQEMKKAKAEEARKLQKKSK